MKWALFFALYQSNRSRICLRAEAYAYNASMSEHTDLFGCRMTFGPEDHKGVDESVLLTVVDGRWQVQAEKINY